MLLGSRRPSLASVHRYLLPDSRHDLIFINLSFFSTTSSIRSYSSRRFEQEIRDKELRHEMKKHLCRLQENQQMQKQRPTIIIGDSIPFTVSRQMMPSTSPHILTPNSTDELLPSVEEKFEDEFSPQFDRKNQP